jgi:antirestriction protein ArdC
MTGKWGEDAYAAEELVAELGAAMLCATLGLSDEPRPDHAQYLKAWVRRLKDDHRLLWNAASLAQKAVDHLTSLVESNREQVAA